MYYDPISVVDAYFASIPNCPFCGSAVVTAENNYWQCPECGHEWSDACKYDYEIALRHPLAHLPSIATVTEFWQDPATGRNIGLVLLFADGHTASLAYNEIHALERGASEASQ